MNKRDQKKYDALRRRVADMTSGAAGTDADNEEFVHSPETLGRFLLAARDVFNLRDDKEAGVYLGHMTGCHMLDEYTSVDKATETLWNAGIRA